MNILFCRYKNICEPDYKDAFTALGVNCVELFINETGAKDLEEQVRIVGEQVLTNTPMFVFSINFFPYISIICEKLKVIYVSVSVTCPMMEIYNTTIRNTFNRVFLFDHEQYLSIKDENPEGIFYLALGAAVERLDRVLSDAGDEYKYDVSFVGSLYNEKDPFIDLQLDSGDRSDFERLIDEQLAATITGQDYLEERITDSDVSKIKGSSKNFYPSDLSVRNMDRFVAINNYLSPHMTYIERVRILNDLAKEFGESAVHLFTKSDTRNLEGVVCHGGVNTITEMPFVFRQSKINLNLTTRSIKTGLPQRIWDVLGAGGFLLTNYQREIPEYFEIGKHLEAYESYEELEDKVQYYLTHEDVRKEIADEGYELVKAKGTTLIRVMEIIRKIAY